MNVEHTTTLCIITAMAKAMSDITEFELMPHYTQDEVARKEQEAYRMRDVFRDTAKLLDQVATNYNTKGAALCLRRPTT